MATQPSCKKDCSEVSAVSSHLSRIGTTDSTTNAGVHVPECQDHDFEQPTQFLPNTKAATGSHPPCPRRETISGPPGLFDRHYSVVNVVPKGETEEDGLRSDLSQSISDRYSSAVHIENGRYCFYEPEERTSPEEKEHFRLEIRDIFDDISAGSYAARLRVAEYEHAWMNLSNKGRADLCRIMNTPVHLWHGLKYFREERKWIGRASDGNTDCMLLTRYGHLDDSEYTCFTEQLSAALRPEELEPQKHVQLVQLWNSALRSGMALDNGEARTAVYQLFIEIVHLLPQMGILSPVQVYHNTHTSRQDGCHTSDSSSSLSPPAKKKLKLSDTLRGDEDADEDEVTLHKQLPTLAVVTWDEKSDCGKYLALIDIHPRGKDDPKVQRKFLQKVLCALQAQDAVFGFLFSACDVMYYYAKREVTGEINVEQFRYPIARPKPDGLYCYVHVGAFQMLIMDLLSALIFGVHKFNV